MIFPPVFTMKSCFTNNYIISQQDANVKKHKITPNFDKNRYINVIYLWKISKKYKNNRKIVYEKIEKYCDIIDDIVKLCYLNISSDNICA